MPYYNLKPTNNLVVRGEFYTSYTMSIDERKHNIILASSKLNNTLVDVGCEFSFNKVVGIRNEKNGFLNAKIIVDGKFTDGVGGGVCQVSTTLYNAVLLSNLKIIEYHAHSLPVSYIAPSFDAMVNSYSADLRFINNTNNPIIIKSIANENTIRIKIIGEKNQYKIERQSEIVEEITPDSPKIIIDKENIYNLQNGEKKYLAYAKNGIKSNGYIIKKKNNKIISKTLIRRDFYKPIQAEIVVKDKS